MTPENERLGEIFMPHAIEKLAEAKTANQKFVHYTSATSAVSIIQKQAIWMRNSLLMNDFQELEYGTRLLQTAWGDERLGGRMLRALEKVHPEIHGHAERLFAGSKNQTRASTYLLSVSEHGAGALEESTHGRLSMWRAYGGTASVAIVLNPEPFFSERDVLKAYSTPVLYADQPRFNVEFEKLVGNIENEADFLRKYSPEEIANLVFRAKTFSVLATKHPGFSEEREWRVVFNPAEGQGSPIKPDIESPNGIPQTVYKLPILNDPKLGLDGMAVSDIIDSIIIGPTEFPFPIYEVLRDLLINAGIPDAAERIVYCGIPIRSRS